MSVILNEEKERFLEGKKNEKRILLGRICLPGQVPDRLFCPDLDLCVNFRMFGSKKNKHSAKCQLLNSASFGRGKVSKNIKTHALLKTQLCRISDF